MDLGLFLLHVVVGLLLFGHGAQKLFGWFGGQGIGGAGEFMQSLRLRPGRLQAFAGGAGEVVGGLLIALGLFLPFAAAPVIAVMVTATVAVHWRNGLWARNGGYEYPLTNIAIAVALAGAGAGELSLDAALGLDLTGAGWALGASRGGRGRRGRRDPAGPPLGPLGVRHAGPGRLTVASGRELGFASRPWRRRVQSSAPDHEGLRRLAAIRLDRPVILSLYLDLDPSTLATPPARATAARSLLDAADRKVRDHAALEHDDRQDLEASIARARELLGGDLTLDGAHAVALFLCRREGLDEAIKLPRSVPSRVAVDRSPFVGPLAGLERRERWCVTLISRRDARVLRGSPDGLREVASIHDDVPGQHDQGGWSQSRYQRSIEKDVADHLKHAGDRLLRHFERQPFERLVVGGPREVAAAFESGLHSYLGDRLVGRIEVDVDSAKPEAILGRARELFEAEEERREAEAIGRLEAGTRAVSGLEDVLPALNERRVQELLLDPDFDSPGALCPECGLLWPDHAERCPADGATLEAREDITEHAIELALLQSADVLPLRRHGEYLSARGGIGALLRF